IVMLDFRTLTVPVGLVRILDTHQYWTLCMFVWCLCFCVTFLILVLELTGINTKLPISWDDFTTAFAMLATLLVLAASVIFPTIFAKYGYGLYVGASVTSCLAFILYAVEVGLTRAKPGELSGFLSTVPGLLKVLEAFVACIIFSCLGYSGYWFKPGLQWCVAVYSICFIFALIVIIFTICRLLSLFPAPFEKVLCGCNVMAVLMYMTAVVIWPLYSFKDSPRPANCSNSLYCPWDDLVVVSFMTCFNLVAYIVDTVYSFRLVFFVSRS
uniref:Myeloid-associated differentiation marker homolog n=1 Tax=Labrus bergylta TaxID=56723 RepID=A0A3Q3EIH5_9LABR